MGAPRKWAAALLGAVERHAPARSRDWALAMLRELDEIDGDWAALAWALGSAGAVLFHAACGWGDQIRKQLAGNEEGQMNATGKKAIGFVSGMLGAFALVLCAFGSLWLGAWLFPSLGLDRLEWTHWLTVIVIPELIFIAVAIRLWRKRTPVAAGILLFAVAAVVHVAIHYATR